MQKRSSKRGNFARAVVELLFSEGVGLGRKIERPGGTARAGGASGDDGEPLGQPGTAAASVVFITSTTILPSASRSGSSDGTRTMRVRSPISRRPPCRAGGMKAMCRALVGLPCKTAACPTSALHRAGEREDRQHDPVLRHGEIVDHRRERVPRDFRARDLAGLVDSLQAHFLAEAALGRNSRKKIISPVFGIELGMRSERPTSLSP